MEKQRLWIRWLGGSLLTISLLFFSNGNVSAAKILTKYGSLPLYREDLMPLTVERPSFYDDPPPLNHPAAQSAAGTVGA